MHADLDEDCKAVVGVSGSIQVVLVLLSDVWHHHVYQSLHHVMERCRESLIPGQLKHKQKNKGEQCFNFHFTVSQQFFPNFTRTFMSEGFDAQNT